MIKPRFGGALFYLHTVLHTINGTKSTLWHDWHSEKGKQKALKR